MHLKSVIKYFFLIFLTGKKIIFNQICSYPQGGITFVDNFSHFYPLDSMLKVLLYAYASFIALASYAQPILPEWSGPSQIVVEDPNKTIADLIPNINDNGKVTLSWKLNGGLPEFFAIERSDNGKPFEIVAVLNNLITQNLYQWMDEAPKNGRNFYRIRYSFKQSDSLYSKTVAAAVAGNISFKFYPNPVDHVLIIRSESPVDVQITDATGKLRITQTRILGLHTLNVSSLEKGVYLIRFSNKLTNVMYQEKLIKN